jgi:hypothetical protein
MKDLIDVGNLVFDRLTDAHGELAESRTLFLYGITVSTTWFILDSAKWVLIEQSGVTKNFDDTVIDSVNSQWQAHLLAKKSIAAEKVMQQIRPQESGPKDGDTFEFWQNETPWREINF